MLIGTVCRFSSRFCAVTMISSRPPAVVGLLRVGETGPAAASARAAGRRPARSALAATGFVARLRAACSLRRRDRVIVRTSGLEVFESSRLDDRAGQVAARRVGLERRPQRRLERRRASRRSGATARPPSRKIGLAHLFGARRAHRAVVLVEAQAALPRTAARNSRAAGALRLRCRRPCARRSRGARGPAAPRRNAPSARRSRGSSGRCRRGHR